MTGDQDALGGNAQERSYYGRPVLKAPVWRSPMVPGYLFLGGLAGGSSVLAAGAQLTGRPVLARAAKVAAAGGTALAAGALIHDLGRPERFWNMLRVFKPTSPMSVGSWLLAGYGPVAGMAAVAAVTGRLPRCGALGTAGAALLGPFVAAYTAALLGDTAVPAWHEAHRELPYVFTGSGATAAGGLGLLTAPAGESRPARRLALLGGLAELVAARRMEHRLGMVAEPYRAGRAGLLLRAGQALTAAGLAGAVIGGIGSGSRRGRLVSAVSGTLLVTASAATRFGVFEAGLASARDPRYTISPQRSRLDERRDRTGRTSDDLR